MICIDNKYRFIKLTNFHQINHNFSYFSTNTSNVTGYILNWGVVQLLILHTLTRDAVSSFYVRIWIDIGEYWHLIVGFKMHLKAHAFFSQLVPIFTNVSSITYNIAQTGHSIHQKKEFFLCTYHYKLVRFEQY